MKRNLKKAIAIALAVLLNLLAVSPAFAQSATDIKGHWAEKQFTQWMEKGLIKGYTDGTAKPNSYITRAEFIALVNRVFGFTKTSTIDFTDVKASDWYAGDIAKAKAAGYIVGENGSVNPEDRITRQEAAVILGRVLKLTQNENNAAHFTDAGTIGSWSKGYIGTVSEKGYFIGYSDGKFGPGESTTRAEAITILSRAAGELYNKAGVYGEDKNAGSIQGNVTISKPGVTLKNTVINGDLYLTEGIGDGAVTLDNVTVKGTTTVSGGGEHSIIVLNSILGRVVIQVPDNSKVRLVAQGSTNISVVDTRSAAKLEEENLTGNGFREVIMEIPEGYTAELAGSFEAVTIENPNTRVMLLNGAIQKVNVENRAQGASIDISAQATVKAITVNAENVSTTGKGIIESAEINGNNASLEQKPASVKVADGVAGTKVANSTQTPTVPNGGGGGGGGNTPEQVAAPAASPVSGEVKSGTVIVLSTATAGAEVHYTLDGSTPTSASTRYTTPIAITAATTIKAIAVKAGMSNSDAKTFSYTIAVVPSGVVSNLVFKDTDADTGEIGGDISWNQPSNKTGIEGYHIYLLDSEHAKLGTVPFATVTGSNSTSFSVPGNTSAVGAVYLAVYSFNAVGDCETGCEIEIIDYKIDDKTVAKPEALVIPPGDLLIGSEIALSSATEGAEIYYTTDGTDPSYEVLENGAVNSKGTVYTNPIKITQEVTKIKAIAVKSNMKNSDVASFTYTIGRVEKPVASIVSGQIPYGTKLSLSSKTAGAKIYYTLNGGTPDTGSSLYTGELTLTSDAKIQAIAVKAGMSSSEVSVFEYTVVKQQVAAPTVSPVPGTVKNGTEITLGTATAGAGIYYTLDGKDPLKAGIKYTTPLIITGTNGQTITLKAVAVKEDVNSSLSTFNYTIAVRPAGIVTDLAFTDTDENAGEIGGSITWMRPADTAGIDGYHIYLLDSGHTRIGTAPVATVTGPSSTSCNLPENTSAAGAAYIAVYSYNTVAGECSSGCEAEIVDNVLEAAKPVAEVKTPGDLLIGSEIALSTATAGADIYYTTNGAEPSYRILDGGVVALTGTRYTETIKIDKETMTIKAIAVKAGMKNSKVASFTYTIAKVAAPQASELPGKVMDGTEVALSSATSGATIYYTLDGTLPTTSSTVYTKEIVIKAATTIKAIAAKAGMANSEVVSFSYQPGVQVPAASVIPGTVTYGTQVELSCATAGAAIYYTTDGSEPTTDSSVYSGVLTLTKDTTIRAIAVKAGMLNSDEGVFAYTVSKLQVATPTASPAAGPIGFMEVVRLATATPGAEIFYTLDGTVPTTSSSPYLEEFQIKGPTTIRAIAVKENMGDSAIATFDYTLAPTGIQYTIKNKPLSDGYGASIYVDKDCANTGHIGVSFNDGIIDKTVVVLVNKGKTRAQIVTLIKDALLYDAAIKDAYAINAYNSSDIVVSIKSKRTDAENVRVTVSVADIVYNEAPTANVASGLVKKGTLLELSARISDSFIYYSLDGRDPFTFGSKYTTPISLTANVTVKAVAINYLLLNSSISTFEYTIMEKVAAPTASKPEGAIPTGTILGLSTATPGAAIYYTTDGTSPSTQSTKYQAPFMVDRNNSTIKAIAVKSGMEDSSISTFAYTVMPQVAAPVTNRTPGAIIKDTKVTLSTSTADAKIYYTTNEDTPTTESTEFTAGIVISDSVTIKAIAVKAGMLNSEVSTFAYTVKPKAKMPTASTEPEEVAPGIVLFGTKVRLASEDQGVQIHYTTDERTSPTSPEGNLYSSPITIKKNVTIRAVATGTGMETSSEASFAYTVKLNKPTTQGSVGPILAGSDISIVSPDRVGQIYYTTDGTVPTAATGIKYTYTIRIKEDITIMAVVTEPGMVDSDVSTFSYTIIPQAEKPTASLDDRDPIGVGYTVALSTGTEGAEIYYTLDGSLPMYEVVDGTPEIHGIKYTGSITVTEDMPVIWNGDYPPVASGGKVIFIRAIAVYPGLHNSYPGNFVYKFSEPVAAPTVDNPGPQVDKYTVIKLSCIEPTATIYYKLDGDSRWTEYTAPITIITNTTLKAIAVKSGMLNSEELVINYTV